ncbi:MAG: DnaJ domain-containing protein, partial [Candidatus Omnitrophota bacterium]
WMGWNATAATGLLVADGIKLCVKGEPLSLDAHIKVIALVNIARFLAMDTQVTKWLTNRGESGLKFSKKLPDILEYINPEMSYRTLDFIARHSILMGLGAGLNIGYDKLTGNFDKEKSYNGQLLASGVRGAVWFEMIAFILSPRGFESMWKKVSQFDYTNHVPVGSGGYMYDINREYITGIENLTNVAIEGAKRWVIISPLFSVAGGMWGSCIEFLESRDHHLPFNTIFNLIMPDHNNKEMKMYIPVLSRQGFVTLLGSAIMGAHKGVILGPVLAVVVPGKISSDNLWADLSTRYNWWVKNNPVYIEAQLLSALEISGLITAGEAFFELLSTERVRGGYSIDYSTGVVQYAVERERYKVSMSKGEATLAGWWVLIGIPHYYAPGKDLEFRGKELDRMIKDAEQDLGNTELRRSIIQAEHEYKHISGKYYGEGVGTYMKCLVAEYRDLGSKMSDNPNGLNNDYIQQIQAEIWRELKTLEKFTDHSQFINSGRNDINNLARETQDNVMLEVSKILGFEDIRKERQKDVKSAYYDLAKQYHPGCNAGEPNNALNDFKMISRAYELYQVWVRSLSISPITSERNSDVSAAYQPQGLSSGDEGQRLLTYSQSAAATDQANSHSSGQPLLPCSADSGSKSTSEGWNGLSAPLSLQSFLDQRGQVGVNMKAHLEGLGFTVNDVDAVIGGMADKGCSSKDIAGAISKLTGSNILKSERDCLNVFINMRTGSQLDKGVSGASDNDSLPFEVVKPLVDTRIDQLTSQGINPVIKTGGNYEIVIVSDAGIEKYTKSQGYVSKKGLYYVSRESAGKTRVVIIYDGTSQMKIHEIAEARIAVQKLGLSKGTLSLTPSLGIGAKLNSISAHDYAVELGYTGQNTGSLNSVWQPIVETGSDFYGRIVFASQLTTGPPESEVGSSNEEISFDTSSFSLIFPPVSSQQVVAVGASDGKVTASKSGEVGLRVVGVDGKYGSGKTTMISVIPGLVKEVLKIIRDPSEIKIVLGESITVAQELKQKIKDACSNQREKNVINEIDDNALAYLMRESDAIFKKGMGSKYTPFTDQAKINHQEYTAALCVGTYLQVKSMLDKGVTPTDKYCIFAPGPIPLEAIKSNLESQSSNLGLGKIEVITDRDADDLKVVLNKAKDAGVIIILRDVAQKLESQLDGLRTEPGYHMLVREIEKAVYQRNPILDELMTIVYQADLNVSNNKDELSDKDFGLLKKLVFGHDEEGKTGMLYNYICDKVLEKNGGRVDPKLHDGNLDDSKSRSAIEEKQVLEVGLKEIFPQTTREHKIEGKSAWGHQAGWKNTKDSEAGLTNYVFGFFYGVKSWKDLEDKLGETEAKIIEKAVTGFISEVIHSLGGSDDPSIVVTLNGEIIPRSGGILNPLVDTLREHNPYKEALKYMLYCLFNGQKAPSKEDIKVHTQGSLTDFRKVIRKFM